MEKLTEEQQHLLEEFERARVYIHKEGAKDGVSKYEQPYGVAYQKLVRAGLRQQIRMKYRPIWK